MQVTCAGARAKTQSYSDRYQHRSLTVIATKITTIWIDCGESWNGKLDTIQQQPDAIFITHAHDDHVGGLENGAPAHVYATQETWDRIDSFPIDTKERHTLSLQEPVTIGDITITPYNVFHSTRAPAVGFRIETDECTLFYSGDLAAIEDDSALDGVDLYIGDGSIITRNMLVTESNGQPVGHAPISQQLQWCANHDIRYAIFTHCGAAIVKQDFDEAQHHVSKLAAEHNITAYLAYDGFTITYTTVIFNGENA